MRLLVLCPTIAGVPYTDASADDEGLAVLPNRPSIRIFAEASANATLEGLTGSPSGRTVVAAMEGALCGDTDARCRGARRRDFRALLELHLYSSAVREEPRRAAPRSGSPGR